MEMVETPRLPNSPTICREEQKAILRSRLTPFRDSFWSGDVQEQQDSLTNLCKLFAAVAVR
jgi:hypothetical protein